MEAFFTLHRDLPREGPGVPEDVAWAVDIAGTPADAMICDVACGPGDDVKALLAACPEGFVLGCDKTEHFIDAARMRHKGEDRARFEVADMARLQGPFDLIWCAGAIYFLGVGPALRSWRRSLKKGGAIAFSAPCYFTPDPSDAAIAFWEGEGDIPSKPALATQIAMAGFKLLAARPLSDDAWAAYHDPMAARIAALAPDAEADAELAKALDDGRREISQWQGAKAETGYLLCVVKPL